MTGAAIIAVAIAGALGAAARLCVDALVSQRTPGGPMWGTITVNVSGSLALGVLVGVVASAGLPSHYELAIGGGFLGAYTTFSTWMVQSVEMIDRGQARAAIVHIAGSLLAGTGVAALGLALGTALA